MLIIIIMIRIVIVVVEVVVVVVVVMIIVVIIYLIGQALGLLPGRQGAFGQPPALGLSRALCYIMIITTITVNINRAIVLVCLIYVQ